MRSLRSTFLRTAALAALLAAGCDSPTGPRAPTEAPEVSALIGDSPLIRLDDATRDLEVTVEVNKGLTEVRLEDKFLLRIAVSFSKDGSQVGGVAPKDIGLTGQKDTGIRQGNTVAILICINIPDDEWSKLLAADADGRGVDAHVIVELIMVDGRGAEHALDRVQATSTIDPQG